MAKLESLLRGGHFSKAHRAVDVLLERNPDNSVALVAQSRLQLLDGDSAESLDVLNRVLARRPNHVPARTYKAVVLDIMGQHRSAEGLLGTAVARDPTFAPAHYNLACTLIRAGRLGEALGALEQAAQLDPENPNIPLRIAEILLDQGEDERAGEVLTALVSTNPNFAAGWLAAARAYMQRGDPHSALAACAAGLTHSPEDLTLILAAFHTAAKAGDLASCDVVVQAAKRASRRIGTLLEILQRILKARTAEMAERACQDVPPVLIPQIVSLLEELAQTASKKRATTVQVAISTLQAVGSSEGEED